MGFAASRVLDLSIYQKGNGEIDSARLFSGHLRDLASAQGTFALLQSTTSGLKAYILSVCVIIPYHTLFPQVTGSLTYTQISSIHQLRG